MDINRNNDDLRHFYHDPRDTGSPLCSAILHKNIATVHELLKRGAKVNSEDWHPVSYAARAGGFFPALEPLLRAAVDTTKSLEISVIERNIDAAKVCLQYGADPAPALRKAIKWEEYRANSIAESAEYSEKHPESSYKKSETWAEKERTEERESQAIVALLKGAMES
jgi:ankyrin repeat protein